MLDALQKSLRNMRPVYKVLPFGLVLLCFGYYAIRPVLATTTDQNKALVRRAFDAEGRGDWALMSELYSPGFVHHSSLSPQPVNWQDYQSGCRVAHTKYPDLGFEIDDVIAEGDKVVVRMSSTIRNNPSLANRDNPDGVLTVTQIYIIRIADGCIVEQWVECDSFQSLQLLMLMGYMPD